MHTRPAEPTQTHMYYRCCCRCCCWWVDGSSSSMLSVELHSRCMARQRLVKPRRWQRSCKFYFLLLLLKGGWVLGWFGWLVFTFHHHRKQRRYLSAENACFSFEENFVQVLALKIETSGGVVFWECIIHGGWLVEHATLESASKGDRTRY